MISNRKRNINLPQSQRLKGFWLLVFGFLFLSHTNIQAQYYNTGVENISIKWRQINTPKFQIVYPDFYEAKAQEFASVLDTIYGVIGTSLKTTPPKVPFLLHTNTAYYNGLSVWAPKRIELWTTSSPTNYPYPWSWQLAIHEWRHAVQVYALKKGASKTLINIFGEHIYGALLAAYIPTWFLEGDAVVAETALTPTGRGKTPDFNMYFKAQVLEKGKYSYDKALLGSMKDYVPDSYIFGYHLTSFGREIYGKDIWADMIENVGRNFWKIETFGHSQKRGINIKKQRLYNQMMDTLSKRWEEEEIKDIETRPLTSIKKLGKTKKYYTNYSSPKQINDSTIVAIKTSNFKPSQLVSITLNNEEDILSPGMILHSYIDAKDNHLLWSELKSHYRWEHENYSDIFEYDIETETYNQITFKKRFYTPSYNPNSLNIIAAIEDDSINNQHLVIIDKTNGEIIKRFTNEESYSKFSYPSWSKDNSEIYLIKANQYGKSLIKYNVYNDKQTTILPFSFNNISKPLQYKDRLFFIGDYDNTYQVYSINLEDTSSSLTQHTQSSFGVMDFIIFNDSLVLSDYSADGKVITYQRLIDIRTISPNAPSNTFPEADIITKQENFIFSQKHIKDTLWESKKYRPISHLFHFHSWAPLYINAQSQDISWGVSAFSQNLLGTSVFEGGLKYVFADKRDEYFINYTYSGLYPIIKASFKYGQRNIIFDSLRNSDFYSSWDEYNTSFSVDFPYSWSDRNWFKEAKYSFLYSYRSISPRYNFNESLTLFHTIGFGLEWSGIRAMANNDITPQLGHTFSLRFQKSITTDNANILAINTSTYLPGLFLNHSIGLDLGFQKNTPTIYYFPNEVAFTSGVYGKYPSIYYGGKISYNLPLAYPDYAIWKLLYIKRIFSRGFFDFGYFDKEYLSSVGVDLKMNFHIFRIEQELQFGVRIGYVTQLNDVFANILFNINI
ncbi:MAG: hypothetical protein H6Q16_1725 [Bacteroidetes bacterium]|nr:hypothetical protein [Bacteroidota bacterium]